MVGKKIKELRLARNLTLKDLSERTGLSVGHLSQFERGIGSLSMHSLELVAEALGTQISYFLEMPNTHEGFITKHYDLNIMDISYQGRIHNKLGNSLPECVLEAMVVTLMPMEHKENVYPKPHRGEEFVYVLEGILTVMLDKEEYTLYPGDSMHYLAEEPHEWLNLTKRIVRLVSVNTPRVL